MRFSGFEHMLSWYAEKTPDKTALIFHEEGLQTLSFSGLYGEVKARSAELKQGGKTCLGIIADGSKDCVVTLFAAVIAGMQVVLLDGSIPDSSLRLLIAYTDVDALWGDAELTESLKDSMTGGVRNGAGKILMFTSGTTERSKAVVLTDKSLCQSAWNGAAKLPLSQEDVLLCMLPLGHVFGLVCGLLWGLSCGAAVALGRGARHYVDDLAYFKPSAVSLVPLLLGFVIKMHLTNEELKLILVGAGACPAPLLAEAANLGIRVCFGYGLTETSSGVAISTRGDPLAMEVCPDDTITLAEDGEILIEAPTCIMQGYYKQPDATEKVLKDGIFYSGDLGRFDGDGKLHITGRKKDVLALPDGTKIFLPEYEAAIAAALNTTELAVAEKNGRAVLILEGVGDKTECMKKLTSVMEAYPRGQQIADIIYSITPLPKTATGKIKRWELQKRLEREQ